MRRLKTVTGVVLLAAVMSMSASLALAGASEAPGHFTKVSAYGTAESPGFFDTVLIMATLVM
jgi:hypothetical protein